MKFDRSEPGIVVSGVAHVAILVAALVAFSDARTFDDASEAVAVEVLTPAQFAEITRGERTAPAPQPEPKPRVDQVAEREELKPEAVELRREVAAAVPPPPPEKPRDLQAEADAKARAEAEARAKAEAERAAAAEAARAEAEKAAAAAAKARAEARARAEAEKAAKAEAEAKARAEAEAKAEEALQKAAAERARAEAAARAKAEAEAKAREEARLEAEQKRREAEAKARAEERKKEAEARAKAEEQRRKEQQRLAALAAEQAKPAPPRPDPKPTSNFDPSAIEKLLTSREKPQQAPSTGAQANRTASLGAPNATGQKLSPSDRERLGALLKEQITACWSPPAGLANASNFKPRVRMSINADGSLAAEPVLQNPSTDPGFRSMAESAMRAIKRCAPFRIPAQYAPTYTDWRDWSITFDAKEMLG